MKRQMECSRSMRLLRVIDDCIWAVRFSRPLQWLCSAWRVVEPVCGKKNSYLPVLIFVMSSGLIIFYVVAKNNLLP